MVKYFKISILLSLLIHYHIIFEENFASEAEIVFLH